MSSPFYSLISGFGRVSLALSNIFIDTAVFGITNQVHTFNLFSLEVLVNASWPLGFVFDSLPFKILNAIRWLGLVFRSKVVCIGLVLNMDND